MTKRYESTRLTRPEGMSLITSEVIDRTTLLSEFGSGTFPLLIPDTPMQSTLLRTALVGNALFSALCGLPLVTNPHLVRPLLGPVAPWIVHALGIGLLLFAAGLFWEVRRPTPPPTRALLITLADLGWVAGSVVLLLLPLPSVPATGKGLIAGVAVVVLTFALLQLAGLRALTRNHTRRTDARSAFDIRKRVDAPPALIWSLLRDLGSIGRFHPDLHTVDVIGDRDNARRTCTNHRGDRWSEDVIDWNEEARAFTLRFDTDAPDFPFPMTEMYGGWTVEPVGDQSDVVLWFEFTVRGGPFGEILAPLVAERSRASLETAIDTMEIEAKRRMARPAAA